MKDIVRIGVIGAGGNIGHTHCENIARFTEGAVLSAVYDINQEKLKDIVDRYGAKVMESADDLIHSDEVDAVLVDSTVADGYLAKNPDKYIYAFKDESEAEEFGIAMGLENTALKEAVDWALAGMEADGYIAETYDYWFGSAE